MFSKSAFLSSLNQSQSKKVPVKLLGESEEIDLTKITTLKETMKIVSKFITTYNRQTTPTPFHGTDLKMTKDGKFFVFGSKDGRIARFNRETQAIDLDAKGDDQAIWTIAFSPDDQFFFIGGQGKSIKKFTLNRFDLVGTLSGHRGEVFMLMVTPDNLGLISASADRSIKYWDLAHKNRSVDIVTHTEAVQAIDLTTDGQYLMTGSEDQTAFLLKKESGQWVLQTTITDESAVFVVKISPSLRFLVTGNQIGTITTWNFGSWEPFKRFQDSNTIWCIEVAENEEFIVTGGMSNNIIIWDMLKEREKVVLAGHKKSIKSLVVIQKQQEIISLSNDSKIIKWKIPAFEERNVVHTALPVVQTWFSNQNGLLYVHCHSAPGEQTGDHELLAFNLINYSQVKECKIQESQIIRFYKSEDDSLFYVIYTDVETSDTCISSYDLNTMDRKFIKNLGPTAVVCFTVSLDHKYLFIGQAFKIITYFLQEPDRGREVYNSQIYHIGTVEHIVSTPDNKYILSADHMGIIKLIDVELMANTDVRNDLCDILEFKKKGSRVVDMKLVNRDSLVAVSYELFLIWSIDKRSLVKFVDKGYCHIDSSLDGAYIFLRSNERLEIWTTQDFSYNCFLQNSTFSDPDRQSFHVSPDNKLFVFAQESKIFVSRSPTSTGHIYICGNYTEKINYYRYLSSIIDDSSEKYIPGFDDWIIEPFHLNALHFYAYYNFDEYLTEALTRNSPFYCTAQGFSPLSISLELDYPNCTNAILRKLREVFPDNPFIFMNIENCLSALNNSGYEKLHSLYELLLSKTFSTNVPKFCSNKPRFPIVLISDDFLPKRENFEGPVVFEDEGNAIVFLQTYVRVPIVSGTSESIEFIESIEGCRNLRIFETEFVQTLLQVKWMQVRHVVYLQMMVYMAYLIFLSFYTVVYRSPEFLLVPFLFNCYFLVYEIWYMKIGGLRYFKDKWNYVDIIRVIGFMLYVILLLTEIYPDKDWTLSLVILISWVRGVAHFRSFKATRYLINLLITSCKDIAAFLLILLYSTFSFALIFYSINLDEATFFDTLTGFYNLNIGNSATDKYDWFLWLFYILVTILNPIIMVNLLISILGDTYATVKEYESVNDAIELISLISEAEIMMFWRRGQNSRQFVHVCNEFNMPITQTDDSIKNKIKTLKRKVMKLTECVESEEKMIYAVSDMFNARHSAISDVIERYENKRK